MRWIRIKIRRKDYLSMREEDILAPYNFSVNVELQPINKTKWQKILNLI
jgi:hypothetical protein